MQDNDSLRFLSIIDVCHITGLKPGTIFKYQREGTHDFPKARKLGPRCSRWRSDELFAWLESRQPVATMPPVNSEG